MILIIRIEGAHGAIAAAGEPRQLLAHALNVLAGACAALPDMLGIDRQLAERQTLIRLAAVVLPQGGQHRVHPGLQAGAQGRIGGGVGAAHMGQQP